MIIYILWGLLLVITLSYEFYAFKTGVPTMPSFPAARRKMAEILKKEADAHPEIQPYQIVDLGSGSGQLTRRIAREVPQAQVLGIELSLVPWLRSYVRQRLFGPRNLAYKRLDFWSFDCSNLDAVVMFLRGNVLERVSEKLRKELKPGALIVSNDYPLPGGWEPIETHKPGILNSNIYVYRQR